MTHPDPPDPSLLHRRILDWYARNGRDLPWRRTDRTPWGVLVCEVMAQQTPIARILAPWQEWMARWPTPADLAEASPADVLRAWGRLGYPRRAIRLRETAIAIVERHNGEVPQDLHELLDLPGVGRYTAAAVVAFAFGGRTTVVDTNVRRVEARVVTGTAQAAPSLTRAEIDLAERLTPADPTASVAWNIAVMELGALVCTARSPRCDECPVAGECTWYLAGRPESEGPRRRGQGYEGTDRKLRGDILQLLRDAPKPLSRAALESLDPDPNRVDRLLDSLIVDGMVEPLPRGRFGLPE